MEKIIDLYHRIDEKITFFMREYGINALRISVGIVFFWFGFLKFFPGLSPAQGIATETIEKLTFGLIPASVALIILAIWETMIGLGLIFGIFLRGTLFLLFTQMLGTMTPLIFFPAETFTRIPYAPTLEGQYIIKNLVLISAGLVVGATVRGGRIIEEIAKTK
ncbi:MAG: DoxX family membrane protein [Anaerolineales bacterium]|uniref:DoxX family membrane protein n=1 Tax=Candidatus Desulfolinea nitratireducens TaxID=2841698 RepID=A0A8J6TFM0_9CHLR|nr:DoxX family membrane protein [Candidatus Desulfolinea nitratireducens]MBL6959541.1 DoxX family membrane protein [Anaerolineales bacterium]